MPRSAPVLSGWRGTTHRPSAAEQWPLFAQYCSDCHNRDDYTAEIAFDRMSAESIAHEPEIFETAVRKLRGAQMPPPGAPQPDNATRRSWVASLETTLDAAAATAPNPGQIALHRLNRSEYANAIADLLALDVDVKALLPKDDESDGFDNVANVLKVSPSFLEQYIAAARVISEMAVGNPSAKRDSRVYYAEPGVNQNYHVAGMPLGTRGGMLVEHFFPADGEYEVDIGGLARARYVEGLEYRHRLILAIDGKKVFEDEIGGPEDVEAVDLRQAAAVAEINGRFENIRVPMTAGPHTIAATFVARTMAESDAVLQPFVPGGGEVGIIEGEESPLKIQRLEINGPFTASGMSETPSRERIFTCRPQATADELPCAREILTRLTRQAFRRPVTDADLEIPLAFYEQGRASGDFEAGVRNALMIVLATPEFLYRFTAPPEDSAPGSVYAVDQYGLASRLSFFLWSSLPDDELLEIGGARRARRPARHVEPSQTHARRSARGVAGNQFRAAVARHSRRARHRARPRAVSRIQPGFRRRVCSRARVVPRERSPRGPQRARALERPAHVLERAARVALRRAGGPRRQFPPRRARRREPLGPVRQGRHLDGDVVPEPHGARAARRLDPRSDHGHAARVAAAERRGVPRDAGRRAAEDGARAARDASRPIRPATAVTASWTRSVSRSRTSTRSARGASRIAKRSRRSTRRASSPTARLVDGPVDLREALLAEPSQFVQTLTEKLMIYALGRSVEYYDMPAVRRIVRDAKREDYRFSAILAGIAQSEPFRFSTTPAADENETVAADVAQE